jgi:hypothetical protein
MVDNREKGDCTAAHKQQQKIGVFFDVRAEMF